MPACLPLCRWSVDPPTEAQPIGAAGAGTPVACSEDWPILAQSGHRLLKGADEAANELGWSETPPIGSRFQNCRLMTSEQKWKLDEIIGIPGQAGPAVKATAVFSFCEPGVVHWRKLASRGQILLP